MLVGVLSDTHDDLERTQQGLAKLQELGAQVLIHCGDLCGEGVMDLLAGDVPTYFVFGNNEVGIASLAAYSRALGLYCLQTHGIVELGGKRFGVTHGDREGFVRDLHTAGVDYLLTGHTHVAHDRLEGKTRYVNPGALHRTRRPSVAVIDTELDRVQIVLI